MRLPNQGLVKGESAKTLPDAKNNSTQPLSNEKDSSTYASVIGKNSGSAAKQGCSHWDGNPPKGKPTSSGRSTPGSDSNNRRKASEANVKPKPDAVKKPAERRKPFECYICGGRHPLFFCSHFRDSDLNDRWAFVNNNSICPICLVAKHPMNECTDQLCPQCKKINVNAEHNSTLCEVSYRNKLRGSPDKNENSG